jgi:hypothetical protein
LPRKMRPSSSASIACIASPAWSGFNRFYQYSRPENAPTQAKPSAPKRKTRHKDRVFSPILKT